MLLASLRYNARSLHKDLSFALVAITSLGLGIGAVTAIFTMIHSVLLQDLPYPEPNRIVMLWQTDLRRNLARERVSPANYADWSARNHSFSAMGFSPAWIASRAFHVQSKEGFREIPGAFVSSGWFRSLGVPPLLGRTFTEADDAARGEPAVILSERLWKRDYGGDAKILGRELSIDSYRAHRFSVIGVMPDGFDFPNGSQLWIPTGYMGMEIPAPDAAARCCSWLEVVARLRPGVGLQQARADMDKIAGDIAGTHPRNGAGQGVAIVSLREQVSGPHRSALVLLFAAVSCVLLIACANVASLQLVRVTGRNVEYTTRAALGATPAQILWLTVSECLLVSAVAGIIGVAGASWTVDLFRVWMKDSLPRIDESRLDGTVLVFSLALSLGTALLCGCIGGWQASRWDLRSGFQDRLRCSPVGGNKRVRRVLVTAELAIAILLTAGAGVFIRSFYRLQSVNPGFRADHILAVTVDISATQAFGDGRRDRFLDAFLSRVQSLPGVEDAAITGASPFSAERSKGQAITREGEPPRPEAESPRIDPEPVMAAYFRTLRIPLLHGRIFDKQDENTGHPVAVINDAAARRYWPGEEATGKRFALGSEERLSHSSDGRIVWFEIIGVVGDTRDRSLDAAPRPTVYFSYRQYPVYVATLVVRTTGDPRRLDAAIRAEARAENPMAVITKAVPLEDLVNGSIAQPRFRTTLLVIFSALALFMAATGLYGVMSYSVSQNVHEIGIRMALGATSRELLRVVMREALIPVAWGLLVGIGALLLVSRWLSGFLYQISVMDSAALAGVMALLAAVTLASAYGPARRACRIDPLSALRHE